MKAVKHYSEEQLKRGKRRLIWIIICLVVGSIMIADACEERRQAKVDQYLEDHNMYNPYAHWIDI